MANTFTTKQGWTLPEVGGDTDAWGGHLNADLQAVENELNLKPRLVVVAVASGANPSFDLSLGRVLTLTVNQIMTISFANFSAAFSDATVPYQRFLLKLTNGGAFAITWPASVTWAGGAAPQFAAAGVDWIEFATNDGGTTVYAQAVHLKSASAQATYTLPTTLSGVTSGVTAETSMGTVSVPAATLTAARKSLDVEAEFSCVVGGGGMIVYLKWGSQYINLGGAAGQSVPDSSTVRLAVRVARNGSNTQLITVTTTIQLSDGSSTATTTQLSVAGTQTDTNAIVVDFKALSGSGNTVTLRLGRVTVKP